MKRNKKSEEFKKKRSGRVIFSTYKTETMIEGNSNHRKPSKQKIRKNYFFCIRYTYISFLISFPHRQIIFYRHFILLNTYYTLAAPNHNYENTKNS